MFERVKPLCEAVLFLVIKMVAVPMLMIGICKMVGLDGLEAKSAVVIAAVPISLASFALVSEYGLMEDLIVWCVFWGTILMLPSVLFFVNFMDWIDVF